MEEKYTIESIREMDFGCEGFPEGKEPEVFVVLKSETGMVQTIQYYDAILYKHNINEGDTVLFHDGKLEKIL